MNEPLSVSYEIPAEDANEAFESDGDPEGACGFDQSLPPPFEAVSDVFDEGMEEFEVDFGESDEVDLAVLYDPEFFFGLMGSETKNDQRLQYNEETLKNVKEVNKEKGLKLYAHQMAGISILLDYKHVLLADDMGLGKTVQSLMAAFLDTRIHRVLLVVPPGLHAMWAENIEHWGKKLGSGVKSSLYSIHRGNNKLGSDIRKRSTKMEGESGQAEQVARKETQYVREKGWVDFLMISPNWLCHDYCSRNDLKRNEKRARVAALMRKFGSVDMMIVDEVHKCSTGPVVAKAILGLITGEVPEASLGIPKVLLLSGTPIRNRVKAELGYLGQILQVENAVKLKYGGYRLRSLAMANKRRAEEEAARQAVLGKILRRTKLGLCKNKNTNLRLPKIHYSKEIVALDSISIQKYRTIEQGLCLYNSDSVITLCMLQVLRQLAISFKFLKPEWQAKLSGADKSEWTNKELKDLLSRIDKMYGDGKGEENTCAICLQEEYEDTEKTPFVYFHCTHFAHASCYEQLLKKRHDKCMMCRSKFKSRRMLSRAEYEALLATMVQVPQHQTGAKVHVPPKFSMVKCYMEKLRRKRHQERLIVFSAFRKPLEGLKQYLDSQGFTSLVVRPGRASDDIAKFKRRRGRYEACLMTLQYAEGFNLDVANHVIFLTLPLSAYEYTQAVDRVYRIGQRRDVHVTDLITKGTIDEIVYSRLRVNIKTIDDFYRSEVEVTAEAYEAATKAISARVGDLKEEGPVKNEPKEEPTHEGSVSTLGKRKVEEIE